MVAEQLVRNMLLQDYGESRAKNARFSMRAYSRRIGVTQSAISEILNGQRKITRKMAAKILDGMDMAPTSVAQILAGFSSPTIEAASFKNLSIDAYNAISEWYHFAILSLAETEGFKCDSQWIASRLGISKKQVDAAVERLARLEMIDLDQVTKNWKPTGAQFAIDPGFSTAALKKAQRENLELAQKELDTGDFERRNFTAITFCFDPDRMDEAKALIKEFRQRFCQLMEKDRKKEVYKMNIQLYPLTKEKS